MKRLIPALVAILLFCSHDMYLKLDSYFLSPEQSASIVLINGTWAESENVIDRDRMQDVSLVSEGQRFQVDTSLWREAHNATILDFKTGVAGTYVAGVSTRPRNIEMEAKAFNDYLEHDGVIDMLDWRKSNNALDQPAIEKYSKHVKTIFQVGNQYSDDWKTVLGYPIEFVPMSNPYHVHPGEKLSFKLLLAGKPLANQLVTLANTNKDHDHDHSHNHDHGHDHDKDDHEHHHHDDQQQLRTADDGTFSVDIDANGKYYIRTIHMVQSEEAGLTHESNWATISFAVNHNTHDHADHDHDHDHDHGHSHDHSHEGDDAHEHEEAELLPAYVYWLGSLVLVGLLFMYFNRKQS